MSEDKYENLTDRQLKAIEEGVYYDGPTLEGLKIRTLINIANELARLNDNLETLSEDHPLREGRHLRIVAR